MLDRLAEIESTIAELCAELSALQAGDDIPRTTEAWALSASVQDLDGDRYILQWSPDGQMSWQTIGLLHTCMVIEEDMARVTVNDELDGE